jgi:mono/diheme cytochrome c family protein/heme/copper-type cytochrome/quinol oxidase subunit 4
MSHKHHGNPVATYIITALILGVITYLEFALVEYDVAWLSRAAIIFWLIALSVVKFGMVVAIFMHLKDDEKTYTGFFGSGLLIALATFLVLPLLFTVRNLAGEVAAQPQAHAEAVHEEPALSEESRRAIESEGYSRPRSEVLDTPPPMKRSQAVQPPAAAEPQASLRDEAAAGEAAGQDAQAQAEQPTQEEQAAPAEQAEQPAAVEFDRALGERTYTSTCQGCHQAGGAGLPGVFPPLAGNMPSLHNAEGGREYLIDVLLYGLTGQIQVNGQTYNGVMPPWAGLSDEQIAAVLNHELTAWGNDAELESFTPILPDEVAARRGASPGNLNERRQELQAQ